MVLSSNLGYPRIGANRELKKWVEAYWHKSISEKELMEHARHLRAHHWQLQKKEGIDLIPSNDFSLYDQVLDHLVLFQGIPSEYLSISQPLDQYFAMARGLQNHQVDVPAMEMKKWFDTNYHYIVGQFSAATQFKLNSFPKPVLEFLEAKALGIQTRPVLLGPITFLTLGRYIKKDNVDVEATVYNHLGYDAPIWSLLDPLLEAYADLFQKFIEIGVTDVQMDEPMLVCSFPLESFNYVQKAYTRLSSLLNAPKIMLTTYFDAVPKSLVQPISQLPIHALHLDLVRASDQVDAFLTSSLTLSLGLVDGRNIWKTDLTGAFHLAERVMQRVGAHRVHLAPSCSLLHSPVSLDYETRMDSEAKSWLSFANEKLKELHILKMAFESPLPSSLFQANQLAIEQRKHSKRIHLPQVKEKVERLTQRDFSRPSSFPARWEMQQKRLQLPLFPTTTVGSFPQTQQVRTARAQFKKGELDEKSYEAFLQKEIQACIRFQEDVGLDVLVHGEFERTDMVEYFGELLSGLMLTTHGWIQSYGSRCVKPPIIFGDVERVHPMTLKYILFAQECTARPVKGMLTGPVTILQWSFVRDDQPRRDTAFQLALAIREEVQDLEAHGIRIIQIDEPAIREGLPLNKDQWVEYLAWAVDAFLLATSGVQDATQVQSHMCYSDFDDIFAAILRMDVDVLLVENARSNLKLLASLAKFGYPRALGPGLYDIHSPRIPAVAEMYRTVLPFVSLLPHAHLWINPDCGMKTREWHQVQPSLAHLCQVAAQCRALVQPKKAGHHTHPNLATSLDFPLIHPGEE